MENQQLTAIEFLAHVTAREAAVGRYKVNPRDPVAFGSAFMVMAIASLAACLLPAWRATRTDPARVLRD
jgi:hypothetical protein